MSSAKLLSTRQQSLDYGTKVFHPSNSQSSA